MRLHRGSVNVKRGGYDVCFLSSHEPDSTDRDLVELLRINEPAIAKPLPRRVVYGEKLPSATELDLLIGCCAPLWEVRFPIDERTLQAHLSQLSISTVPDCENPHAESSEEIHA